MRLYSLQAAICFFCVLSVNLVSSAAQAATTVSPFFNPTGDAILAPTPVNGVFPVSSATGPQANWLVEQWGNPDTLLAPFVKKPNTGTASYWLSSNGRGQVQAEKTASGQFIMQLHQDGSTLNCGATGAPLEDDLFLAPNSKSINPTYPSATLTDSNPSVNLTIGSMTALQVKGWVRISKTWTPAAASRCSANQSSLLWSVILKNTAVTPSQILYYQIGLTGLFCAPGTDPSIYRNCLAYKPVPQFYLAEALLNSQGQIAHYQYGLEEPITVLNLSLQKPSSTPTIYNFNLLPRLTTIIKAGSPAVAGVAPMDTDPTHWRISSIYFGSHIWGDIGLESYWNGMLPVVTE